MEKVELAVVMPVYNEEEIIFKTINRWTQELESNKINFQIHVYNDGSRDDTLRRLKEIEKHNKALFVHNKTNNGHGPTILLGYRENSDAEWIFQIDSDNEMDPRYFSELWHKRKDYDFLIGRRDGRRSRFSRRIISLISRIAVRIFYGCGVWDVNSPYRLIKTWKFKDIFFKIPDRTFAPNVIISGIACYQKNIKIIEIPVMHQNRRTGKETVKKWKLFNAALKSLYQTIIFRFIELRK